MSLGPRGGTRSPARATTAFTRRWDGKRSLNLKSENGFTPQTMRLSEPMISREGKTRRFTVLDEPSFKKIILEENCSSREARTRFGVNSDIFIATRQYWSLNGYADAVKLARRKNHQRVMWGNKRGSRSAPYILLPREALEPLAKVNMGTWQMAYRLGVSEFLVRRNLQHYGLQTEGRLPRGMGLQDLELAEMWDAWVPGLLEALKNHRLAPETYFDKLYQFYLRLFQTVWLVQEQLKRHSYYVEKGTVIRSHVSWSTNLNEMRVAIALLDAKIPHARQVHLQVGKKKKKYIVDFLIDETLVLEVDGTWHDLGLSKKNDAQRDRELRAAGYRVLHVKTSKLESQLANLLVDIQKLRSKQ